MNPRADSDHTRVNALQQCFERIARTRMQDVPVQNLRLQVQAVGFARHRWGADERLLGVLVTPWFMALLRLPVAQQTTSLGVGHKAMVELGGQRFEFIGAREDDIGPFESCSLFSPMFEFSDQAAAVATAEEVLRLVRARASSADRPAWSARRGFLLGRSRAEGVQT